MRDGGERGEEGKRGGERGGERGEEGERGGERGGRERREEGERGGVREGRRVREGGERGEEGEKRKVVHTEREREGKVTLTFLMGRLCTNCSTFSLVGVTKNCPFGLFISEATLASILLGAMPALAVRVVFSWMRALISWTTV